MDNGWKVTAIIFIILTMVISVLYGLTIIGYIVIEYEYEDIIEDWCEISNDMAELYNTQLEWLIYYDSETWEEIESMEIIDCEL